MMDSKYMVTQNNEGKEQGKGGQRPQGDMKEKEKEKEGAAVEEERRIKRNFWESLFPEATLRGST